jgi:maltooligosyltrehalose trehalohydrolase
VPERYPWERPLGARPREDGQTEFRVWAPRARTLTLDLGGPAVELEPAGYDVYETVAPAEPDADYQYLVDGQPHPDPASRWQPDGVRGPSRVYSPATPTPFATPALEDLVVYELHIGTFSPEGTFESAIPFLPSLADLGVNAIEIMPVAEFPGARGWGYDGVYISAAQSSYGGPAGLQRLLSAAHEHGLAVILDVVYNHVGATGGESLEAFGPYFTGKYETPWGKAMNFDDQLSDPVREWMLQSAEGWVRDFGFDGLRLDAIHAIFDSSAEHIVAAVARRVHTVNPRALVIAESGLNDPRVMRGPERGGHGCDAAWADDFHHSLRTLLTDERDGYYEEFGRVAQLAKAFHRPYIHDGSYSTFRKRCFGAPAEDVLPERFVVFSQNHDQVGNRAFGDRMPLTARPLAAFCTLLSPFTPMLWMGEEYGETAPFQFFSDHIDPYIADMTRKGRRAEFAAFASFGQEIPDPQSPETFRASKLTRQVDPAIAALYGDLLHARHEIGSAETQGIEFDEPQRWLRLTRGAFELAMNFGREVVRLPAPGRRLLLATDPRTDLQSGSLVLAPMSGVLLG